MILLLISIYICLALIIYYDIRFRALPVIILILLNGLIITQGILNNHIMDYLYYSVLNFGFVVFIVSFLFAYVYLLKKEKKIFKKFIGWGDVFILLIMCIAFSPVNYMIFFTLASFFTLITWSTIRFIKKRLSPQIPFAGFISFFYFAELLISGLFSFNNYNDHLLLDFISTC